jgi:translation initiation factor 1
MNRFAYFQRWLKRPEVRAPVVLATCALAPPNCANMLDTFASTQFRLSQDQYDRKSHSHLIAPKFGEASVRASRLVSSLAPPNSTKPAKKNRGRVDILRVKAGRGGKTVTVVKNFVGIGLPEKQQLAKAMQKACGTGGTVKDGQIEIQGDKREEVARILIEANFRPVFAGG